MALTVKSHLDEQDWNTQVGKVDNSVKIKSEDNSPSQESANIDNEVPGKFDFGNSGGRLSVGVFVSN